MTLVDQGASVIIIHMINDSLLIFWVEKNNHATISLVRSPMYLRGGLSGSQSSCWTQRIEKDKEYGLTWLRKRVSLWYVGNGSILVGFRWLQVGVIGLMLINDV